MRKKLKKIHKRISAFTLIEILIVIVLLGALITTVFFLVSTNLKKARDARRKMNLHVIKNKLEVYYYSKEVYPKKLPDCNEPLMMGDTVLIKNMPCDPQTKENYVYVTRGPRRWFKLYTKLENLADPIIGALGCWQGCGPDCGYNYGVTSSNTKLLTCAVYVCAPGGGSSGRCEAYGDPGISNCPKVYPYDPSCNEECGDPANRCENASGKNIPEE